MFYRRQTNQPWGLMWDKLVDIYNDDRIKTVKSIDSQYEIIVFFIFRKNVVC